MGGGGVVNATHRPLYLRERYPALIVQEAGPGRVRKILPPQRYPNPRTSSRLQVDTLTELSQPTHHKHMF